MAYQLAANAVLLIHLAFIFFAVAGGLLCLRYRWVIWIHVPAFFWAFLVSIMNWTCPLTPLENYFLERTGRATYEGDFIAQYLLPIIYPTGMTPAIRVLFGAVVLLVNFAIYAAVVYRFSRASRSRGAS